MFFRLLPVFVAACLSCAPASPAMEKTASDGLLQQTAITTAETLPGPAAPRQASDSAVARRALSVSEPVALPRPHPGQPAEPFPEFDGRQIKSETGAAYPAPDPDQRPSAQDWQYTWQDGNRTMIVLLQPDLTAANDGRIRSRDTKAAAAGSVRSAKAGSGAMPMFRSPSGTLMTLPGGVLLALDRTWTETEINAFLARNGIKSARVSELGYIANGVCVASGPRQPA